jgi:GntR family transcriptional regulator / MocR family aminotransferase
MDIVIPLSRGGEPLYRQLYLGFRRAILEGRLRAGERLPSTRDLAEQLSVSRTIVVMAFEQLLAEGFVEGRHGSGTFVSALGEKRRADRVSSARLTFSRFGRAAALAGVRVDFPARNRAGLRYDFSCGRSPVERFPMETWRRILIQRTRRATVKSHQYGAPSGDQALREAIASHLRRSRAVICEASQVIIVNGSQQALDLLSRVMLEPGDTVALEDPQYQGGREAFRAAGARLYPVAVDGDGLIPAKLPKTARLAFVTPSHQFPTGAVLPLARRMALLEWSKRAGAVLIEDDYDGEFRYEGQAVESLQGLDTEGRVVYVGTFSRTVFPALRIGYLIAPKPLVPALTGAKWLADRHTATLEQETLAEFIASGAYERHLRRARRTNAKRRAALLSAIEEFVGDHATVTGQRAGTHVVLWPKSKLTENEIIARAAEHEVTVYGIAPYYLTKPKLPGLILGYARMKEADIREGIRRLGEALEE